MSIIQIGRAIPPVRQVLTASSNHEVRNYGPHSGLFVRWHMSKYMAFVY